MQNMLSKMEAMDAGVVKGICAVAGNVASALGRAPPDFPAPPLAVELIRKLYQALVCITETPSVGFYSKPPEVKREFFEKLKRAWSEVDIRDAFLRLKHYVDLDSFAELAGVNHALFLTFFFMDRVPDEFTENSYLSVMSTIAQAFDATFPAENSATRE
jgi:hypothetical protein